MELVIEADFRVEPEVACLPGIEQPHAVLANGVVAPDAYGSGTGRRTLCECGGSGDKRGQEDELSAKVSRHIEIPEVAALLGYGVAVEEKVSTLAISEHVAPGCAGSAGYLCRAFIVRASGKLDLLCNLVAGTCSLSTPPAQT